MEAHELLDIDKAWVDDGHAEFIFREPAGRKLIDRVLDVVHISRMAFGMEGIDRFQVLYSDEQNCETDAFRIAEQLFESKFCE